MWSRSGMRGIGANIVECASSMADYPTQGLILQNLEQQKDGKNEKDLYIHNRFDSTDSLHSASGPDT
jgi:hypothetical protein